MQPSTNTTIAMECLPAIDIRAGQCVRLLQGDYNAETIFGDPIEQARRYVNAGAQWIHVVDLDAARSPTSTNRELIASIIRSIPANIQVGGGIRDLESASFYLDNGAVRVILGSAIIEAPSLVEELAELFPQRVGLGIDYRLKQDGSAPSREVAIHGWRDGSGMAVEEVLARFAGMAIPGVVLTDISRDGTLEGPNLADYEYFLSSTSLPLVASGGVKDAADVAALARLQVAGRAIQGVVIGRALLSGSMTLEKALDACRR